MKLVSQNYLGISIIAISLLTFVMLLSVSLEYANITHLECNAPFCTAFTHIPPQSYIGFGLLLVSAGLGFYLTLQPQKIEKMQAIPKAKLNKIITNLEGEEKKVFDEVAKNDGSIFQNDLTGTTGFSKVKVSRVLDRLETKGLVERRRRGMSNIVVLKY